MFYKMTLRLGMLFSILAISCYSCSYSARTAKKLFLQAEKNAPYELIVVPGVPLENGQWTSTMKARVVWSVYLFKKGITKNIVFSGAAVSTPYVEAAVMAAYARALGVPAEHVYTEPIAEHSTENIYYGYKKGRSLGFKKIALASDPFQTKMLAGFAAKKLEGDIGLIPMVYDSLQIAINEVGAINLNLDSLEVKPFRPLKDREGFSKRFRGTRGKNINEKAYE
jgi:uncharacterized SAM-binding protein YcdF (DUF218 family)